MEHYFCIHSPVNGQSHTLDVVSNAAVSTGMETFCFYKSHHRGTTRWMIQLPHQGPQSPVGVSAVSSHKAHDWRSLLKMVLMIPSNFWKLGQLVNRGFLDSCLSNSFKVYIKVLTRVRDENLD